MRYPNKANTDECIPVGYNTNDKNDIAASGSEKKKNNKRKRTPTYQKVITIFLTVVLLLLPLLHLTVLFLPPVYSGSFVGALDEKLERLSNIEEEKIVFVGGSSVAFGLDSASIESYTGMPVVNFGLYAALGTKVMLDLSLPHIKSGDIVVLAPELDAETLSMYFSGGTTLRALDGSFLTYAFDIPFENWGALLGASWDYAGEKLNYLLFNEPSYNDIYKSESFNEYGDIKAGLRPENTLLRNYHDPNKKVSFNADMLSGEFEEYLNEYISACKQKGAEVLFAWCPVNSLAVADGTTEEDIEGFALALEERIDARFITNIFDSIIEPGYFYDTNFHLNDAGVTLHTKNIIESLLLDMGIPTRVTIEVPEAPPLPSVDVRYFETDENEIYFEYEALADGSYRIARVKEEYKNLDTLTIPNGYDTFMVTEIGKAFLEGTSVKKIIIPSDTNVSAIMNGAFLGASSLSALEIRVPVAGKIVPPDTFEGTSDDFVVYIPASSDYKTHYGWGDMGLKFENIKEE